VLLNVSASDEAQQADKGRALRHRNPQRVTLRPSPETLPGALSLGWGVVVSLLKLSESSPRGLSFLFFATALVHSS
jgi:hypothetical protein